MSNEFTLTFLGSILCLLPALLCILLYNRQQGRNYRYLYQFIALFILSDLINAAGIVLQKKIFPHLELNWIGKLLVMALQVAYIVWFTRIKVGELGLNRPSFKNRMAFVSVIIAVLIVALKFYTNYKDKDIEPVGLERWIGQLTLIGIQEEFTYRAVYWALLLRFLRPDPQTPGHPAGDSPSFIIIPIVLLFAMPHAVLIDSSYHVHFSSVAFISALLGGSAYSLLRWSTRSVYPSIFFHNLLNGAICMAQSIK